MGVSLITRANPKIDNMHLCNNCIGVIIALMQTSELSLRERRRERTWVAIHEQALKLARAKGLRGATIEEIASAAGISTRTFFNYFTSKEDAVLGLREPALTEELLATDARHESENAVTRVTYLLLQVMRNSFGCTSQQELRQRLEEFPELKHRLKMHHIKSEQMLISYLNTVDWQVFDEAGRHGPFRLHEPKKPPSLADAQRTRATVQLASAVLRQLQFASNITEDAEIERRIQQTVTTFYNLLKEN